MSTIIQKTAATQIDPPRSRNAKAAAAVHNMAAVGKNQQKIESINPKANNMTALTIPTKQEISTQSNFSNKQLEILKTSICKGLSNEEFEVFLMACSKTQLDPFMKQIYAIKRGAAMTIQTGIDGYRLIAERTDRYAPGEEPTYKFDQNGNLISATAYIKKQTKDGTWHTISASAYLDEYCQKSRDGLPMGMWSKMSKTMLAKCAEAQALRKAFPAEMSGVYTKEEMMQADNSDIQEIIPRINLDQAKELDMILGDCSPEYRTWVFEFLKKKHNVENIYNLPLELFERVKSAAVKNMEETTEKQRAVSSEIEVAESVQ